MYNTGWIGPVSLFKLSKIFLTILFILASCSNMKYNCYYDRYSKALVYKRAETMPTYNGIDPWHTGLLKDFTSFFKYNYRDDEVAQTHLRFQFIIKDDGSMLGARIIGKKEEELSSFEQEGLKALRLCSKWSPGKIHGKNVNMLMTFFVVF